MADLCVVRGRFVFTLSPYRDPFGKRSLFKWIGFRDGQRIGFYRTKTEFIRWIDWYGREDLGPQEEAAHRVEEESTREGFRLLDVLARAIAMNGVSR